MNKKRILIVEDEVIIAQNIAAVLMDAGYTVTGTVATGEQAIGHARQNHPDLILMDIVLNGDLTGIETCRHIQRNVHIPVIFLTAYSGEDILRQLNRTEPYGYIVKPFTDLELLSAV